MNTNNNIPSRRRLMLTGFAALAVTGGGTLLPLRSGWAGPTKAVAVDTRSAEAMINSIRRKHGKPPVRLMGGLVDVARSHSVMMAKKGKITHDFGRGTRLPDRLKGVVNFAYASENVGAGYGSLEAVLEGWMKSRGHRRNMLNRRATHFGIAMARNPTVRYKTYWTLILVRPA